MMLGLFGSRVIRPTADADDAGLVWIVGDSSEVVDVDDDLE